ncbi:MAG: photosynthetic complex assembly protein PuhC [Pseudomonadota bacterium]
MSDRPLNVAQSRHPQLVNRDKEMIPTVLVKAMFMLALTSLLLVTYAVLTDRPLTGVPQAAPEIASRVIILDGDSKGAVTVTDENGVVLADHGADTAGFLSVVWRSMNRTRMLAGVPETDPLRLVEFENGRLAIFDAQTGWSIELGSFGKDNRATFAALLSK